MSLLVYPQEPKPDVPFEITYIYDILRSDISFAFSYKIKRTYRPKRVFSLNYSFLKPQERDILYNFYIDVNNSEDGVFYFITPVKFSLKNEFIAKVVDTTQTIFRIPLYQVENIEIYVNNNFVSSSYYDLYFEYPSLYIIFKNFVLNTGDLITCNFKNGNLCLICEFADNSLGLKQLVAGYSSISNLKIAEVLNY